MAKDFFQSKADFNKKYLVYIEKSNVHVDGYKYCRPQYAPLQNDKKNFILVFHFKKVSKSINPLIVIDSLEGDDFSEKITFTNHFKKNHALTYCVSIDGLGELIKEDEND